MAASFCRAVTVGRADFVPEARRSGRTARRSTAPRSAAGGARRPSRRTRSASSTMLLRRAGARVLRQLPVGVADVEHLGDHPDVERLAGPHAVALLLDVGDRLRHLLLRRPLRDPAVAARRRRAAARASTSHRSRSAAAAAAAGRGRSPTSPTYSSVHASRMPSIASSVSRPRSANGTPSASNSPSTCPAPTPRITRPPERWSSVANAFAVSSGWRYAAT